MQALTKKKEGVKFGGSEASSLRSDPDKEERWFLPYSLESIFGQQGSNCGKFERILAKDGWVINRYIAINLN